MTKIGVALTSVVLTSGILLALAGCVPSGEIVALPEMVGQWEGEAKIIVAWCEQEWLPVFLTIHEDGTVEGKAGDATLRNGIIRSNRVQLGGQMLNIGSDYIVVADLEGAIVAAEGISRDGVTMPVDFDGSRFDGGLATTGTKTGGKETMILTAYRMTLSRVVP